MFTKHQVEKQRRPLFDVLCSFGVRSTSQIESRRSQYGTLFMGMLQRNVEATLEIDLQGLLGRHRFARGTAAGPPSAMVFGARDYGRNSALWHSALQEVGSYGCHCGIYGGVRATAAR